MMVFHFLFRAPPRKRQGIGHAIVVAPDVEDAERRFKRLLDKYGARNPGFNAQYAWDEREILNIPLDTPFGSLLHDGVVRKPRGES